MKVKIIINTIENGGEDASLTFRTSEVWSGELNILSPNEYLTKISILAEGQPQPICDVPFSPFVGYYMWVPPMVDDDVLEEREQKVIDNTEE